MTSADIGQVLNLILYVALIVLIARFILDWVQLFARNWRPRGFVLIICEVLYSVTDPPLRAVRKLLPPLRLGQVMLDLSPMILIIGIYILQAIVRSVFF
ncbi:YggT family protein [Aeromicrobium sp. UC242_57]|uniref:YggT family protein n=1 Tax=Aeromicrobium sp. UC242_57 TaxID=3374624 RepID=UPI003799A4D2